MLLISKTFAPYKVFSRDRGPKKGNCKRKRNLPYRKVTDAVSELAAIRPESRLWFLMCRPMDPKQLSGRLATQQSAGYPYAVLVPIRGTLLFSR